MAEILSFVWVPIAAAVGGYLIWNRPWMTRRAAAARLRKNLPHPDVEVPVVVYEAAIHGSLGQGVEVLWRQKVTLDLRDGEVASVDPWPEKAGFSEGQLLGALMGADVPDGGGITEIPLGDGTTATARLQRDDLVLVKAMQSR